VPHRKFGLLLLGVGCCLPTWGGPGVGAHYVSAIFLVFCHQLNYLCIVVVAIHLWVVCL